MGVSIEMPKYTCHKQVYALKIESIEFSGEDTGLIGDGALITPTNKNYAPFLVPKEYVDKHKPQVGGYYVVYKGGYQSWSPAAEFESGYTLNQ